jgi:hypothetical protein
MTRELTRLAGELVALVDVDDVTQHAMGAAGKAAALETAARDLGADRRFSGIPSKAAGLNAGYDLGNPVVVHLRPEGLWILAEHGRRRSGVIRPKRSRTRRGGNRKPRGRAAVGTAGRFVAVGRYRPSPGKDTISDALALMDERVPEAIGDAIVTKLRRFGR